MHGGCDPSLLRCGWKGDFRIGLAGEHVSGERS
jgi:hypothetical protein